MFVVAARTTVMIQRLCVPFPAHLLTIRSALSKFFLSNDCGPGHRRGVPHHRRGVPHHLRGVPRHRRGVGSRSWDQPDSV